MIRAISVIALLFLCFQSHSQRGWMKFYPGDSTQLYTTVLPQENGDFILGGDFGTSGSSLLYTRIDGAGEVLWSLHAPPPGPEAALQEIAMLGDSLVFAAGSTFSPNLPINRTQGFIQFIGTDGNLRWTKRLNDPPNSLLQHISTAESGAVYACGTYWSDSLNRMLAFVTSVDLNGDEVWRKEFQLPTSIAAISQVPLPNGDLMVHYYDDQESRLAQISSTGIPITEFIFSTPSYNAPFSEIHRLPNGHLLGLGKDNLVREWTFDQGFIRQAAVSPNSSGIAPTSTGEVVIFGIDYTADGNFYAHRLRSDLSFRWYKSYASGGVAQVYDAKETADGGLIIAGRYRPEDSFVFSGMVVRLDCNGDLYEQHLCGSEIQDFVLFPNPNSGNAYLGIPDDIVYQTLEIDVWDAVGRLVQRISTKDAFEVNLKMENLNQGTYFLHVKHDGKIIWRTRWLVQR